MSSEAGKSRPGDDEPVSIDDDDDLDVDDGDGGDDGDDFTDTVILSDTSDNDDDDAEESTAEINVERLIAELEKTDDKDAARRKEIRRRLEELAEEKSFEDTYAIDFD